MGQRVSKRAPSLEEASVRATLSAAEIPNLDLVSHATYALFAALAYNNPKNGLQCPPGWEVFLDCASLNLDREGYYAVAYVNRATRQCVVAQRGTTEVLAVRAGVWFYFEEPTIQFFLAQQFSRHVRFSISLLPDPEDWVVSYTGHSFGAILAACRAVEEGTFAVTFESAGSLAFIRKTTRGGRASLDADVVAYVRPPNPINTLKPHGGYMVMLPATNPDGTPEATKATVSGPGSLVILPQAADAPPELAARSPIMAELPAEASGSAPAATGETRGGHTLEHQPLPATAATASRTPSPAPAKPQGRQGQPPAAPSTWSASSLFSSARLRVPTMPAMRPQAYLRDYMLGGVGFGVPELQQYVGKVEPVIREMLERTKQLHSVNGILAHFVRGDHSEDKVVLQWPAHLMQFIEYYNAERALEDPDNQTPYVNAAYKALMRRLFDVAPLPRSTVPLRYVNADSQKLVRLWWAWDAQRRRALPLTAVEHKALNCITIDGDNLRATVLTALQAKQFLASLVMRSSMASVLTRVTASEDGSPVTITSAL